MLPGDDVTVYPVIADPPVAEEPVISSVESTSEVEEDDAMDYFKKLADS